MTREPFSSNESDLTDISSRAKTAIFAVIARRRHLQRNRTRVAVVVTSLAIAVGGFLIGGLLNQGILGKTEWASIRIPAPSGAAQSVLVTITCAGDGAIDAKLLDGSRASQSCDNSKQAQTLDLPLNGSTTPQLLTVKSAPDVGSIQIATSYLYSGPEQFAFGATDVPALVAAVGASPDGAPLQGFVRVDDVQPPSAIFLDKEARSEWFETFRSTYPTGKPVPLYDSTGITQIGTYTVTY